MRGRLSGLEKSYGFLKVLGLQASYGIIAALEGVSEDLYSGGVGPIDAYEGVSKTKEGVSCKGPGT